MTRLLLLATGDTIAFDPRVPGRGAFAPGAARVGAISARGLAPVKARAALMVALGEGGVKEARAWFDRFE